MAKGSVRKKGKKWYYRFYVEDESGNRVQKEYPGTESKSETEALLRRAMEDYESRQFVAKATNITLGDMLTQWINEEVVPSGRSNGTVRAYSHIVDCIKALPLGKRKLQTVKAEHLQKYFDSLTNVSSMRIYSYAAVLRGAFRFAVFPKQLITFNPMQYVNIRAKHSDYALFEEEDKKFTIITLEQFKQIAERLQAKKSPALLPIKIAYYTGLRLGEVCALTWQDIDLDEQCLTVRRSMIYDGKRKASEIGPTKRSKIRTVDFGDTLTNILKEAKAQQQNDAKRYKELYKRNYYRQVKEDNRTYYDLYALDETQSIPDDYTPVSFVCRHSDGKFVRPELIDKSCNRLSKEIEGLDGFHFHSLRHTFTSNLLAKGAAPKDVQELLGHSDVNLTMNVYAHATKETKRSCVRLLDTLENDDE